MYVLAREWLMSGQAGDVRPLAVDRPAAPSPAADRAAEIEAFLAGFNDPWAMAGEGRG